MAVNPFGMIFRKVLGQHLGRGRRAEDAKQREQ
jgi:hypothetical protein